MFALIHSYHSRIERESASEASDENNSFRNACLRAMLQYKAIHYKRERRPITLELQEREEHLRAARNYGEEAEEKDRDEGEGREPREEA